MQVHCGLTVLGKPRPYPHTPGCMLPPTLRAGCLLLFPHFMLKGEEFIFPVPLPPRMGRWRGRWVGRSTVSFYKPASFSRATHINFLYGGKAFAVPGSAPTLECTVQEVRLLTSGNVRQKQDVVGGAPNAAGDLSITLTLHFVSNLGIKVTVHKLDTEEGKERCYKHTCNPAPLSPIPFL